jgi:hypothetical protein
MELEHESDDNGQQDDGEKTKSVGERKKGSTSSSPFVWFEAFSFMFSQFVD